LVKDLQTNQTRITRLATLLMIMMGRDSEPAPSWHHDGRNLPASRLPLTLPGPEAGWVNKVCSCLQGQGRLRAFLEKLCDLIHRGGAYQVDASTLRLHSSVGLSGGLFPEPRVRPRPESHTGYPGPAYWVPVTVSSIGLSGGLFPAPSRKSHGVPGVLGPSDGFFSGGLFPAPARQ
jgi:hypothetical protein